MCLVNDDECSPSKRCLPDQNLPTRIPIDPTTGFSPIHSPSYSNAQTVSYASTSVTSYGSSTLAGANTYSPPIHYAQAPPPPPPPQAQDKLTPEPSPGSKRRQAEEYSSNKRRRGVNGAPAAVVDEGDDGDDGEDAHVGPNGGPKHWTAAEKSKLFNWMLGQDDQWESLKAKMNTVFRDVSIFHHGTNAFISLHGLHGLISFFLYRVLSSSLTVEKVSQPSKAASIGIWRFSNKFMHLKIIFRMQPQRILMIPTVDLHQPNSIQH